MSTAFFKPVGKNDKKHFFVFFMFLHPPDFLDVLILPTAAESSSFWTQGSDPFTWTFGGLAVFDGNFWKAGVFFLYCLSELSAKLETSGKNSFFSDFWSNYWMIFSQLPAAKSQTLPSFGSCVCLGILHLASCPQVPSRHPTRDIPRPVLRIESWKQASGPGKQGIFKNKTTNTSH